MEFIGVLDEQIHTHTHIHTEAVHNNLSSNFQFSLQPFNDETTTTHAVCFCFIQGKLSKKK